MILKVGFVAKRKSTMVAQVTRKSSLQKLLFKLLMFSRTMTKMKWLSGFQRESHNLSM